MARYDANPLTCIADTHADNKGKTWCGVPCGFDFVFTGVDHAALSGRNKDRLVVCPECLSAVIEALWNGIEAVEIAAPADQPAPAEQRTERNKGPTLEDFKKKLRERPAVRLRDMMKDNP